MTATAIRTPAKFRHVWLAQHDDLLRSGYRNGDPVSDIARRIGVTNRSVHGRARSLGIAHTSQRDRDLKGKIFAATIPVPWSGCWLWAGAVNSSGYAIGRLGTPSGARGSDRVHRTAYKLFCGDIPSGYEIDHLCRVRSCVNPEHLEPVTPIENWRRGNAPSAKASRRDHCIHGHPYAPDNLYLFKDGSRACRICVLARGRLRREARRMAAQEVTA